MGLGGSALGFPPSGQFLKKLWRNPDLPLLRISEWSRPLVWMKWHLGTEGPNCPASLARSWGRALWALRGRSYPLGGQEGDWGYAETGGRWRGATHCRGEPQHCLEALPYSPPQQETTFVWEDLGLLKGKDPSLIVAGMLHFRVCWPFTPTPTLSCPESIYSLTFRF